MKPLHVDLKPVHGPWRLSWAFAFFPLILAAGLGAATVRQGLELRDVQDRLRDIVSSRAVAPPAPIAPPRPLYEASAREMLAEATSPWPAMLSALETVAVPGVTPVSIEIVSSQRQIRVDVEFSDYAALLGYLEELNTGEPTPLWALVQTQGMSNARMPQGAAATAQIRGDWGRRTP